VNCLAVWEGMADPLGGPRVDIIGDFEMRKYKRGESSSLSSGDDKGIMFKP
jgi:hypothetical protein